MVFTIKCASRYGFFMHFYEFCVSWLITKRKFVDLANILQHVFLFLLLVVDICIFRSWWFGEFCQRSTWHSLSPIIFDFNLFYFYQTLNFGLVQRGKNQRKKQTKKKEEEKQFVRTIFVIRIHRLRRFWHFHFPSVM